MVVSLSGMRLGAALYLNWPLGHQFMTIQEVYQEPRGEHLCSPLIYDLNLTLVCCVLVLHLRPIFDPLSVLLLTSLRLEGAITIQYTWPSYLYLISEPLIQSIYCEKIYYPRITMFRHIRHDQMFSV